METRINELVADVKQIAADISTIKTSIAANSIMLDRNTQDVAHHIKRTDLLEKRVSAAELPFKAAKLTVAFVGGLASLAGVLWGLFSAVKHFVP